MNRYELRKIRPEVHKPAFALRAVPKAALYVPEVVWPDPPYGPALECGPDSERVNMSLVKVVSKKVHKSAVIRKTLMNRVKLAITLVVVRGAEAAMDENGEEILVFDGEKAGHRLVLNGV